MSPKYNCEYKYSRPFGQATHTWTVVGAMGAVHLHITDRGEDKGPGNCCDRYYGGLEMHCRQSPDGNAPQHDPCWLLHGPCWTTGSSLAASEVWIPLWLVRPHDHDGMFTSLMGEADRLLERDEDDG